MTEEIKEELKTEQTEEVKQEETKEETKPDIKEVAKKYKHQSREEWVAAGNDPDDYLSEKQFMRFGELFNTLRDLKETVKRSDERSRRAEQEGYKKAIEQLKQQRKDAYMEGNEARAEQIDQKIDEIKEQQIKDKPTEQQQMPPMSPAAQKWVVLAESKWLNYNTPENKQMADYAIERNKALVATHPNMPDITRFEIIEEEVKDKFMSKQTKKETPRMPTVETPRQAAPSVSTSKIGYDDLPASLKKIVDKFEPHLIKQYGNDRGKYRQAYVEQLIKAGTIKTDK